MSIFEIVAFAIRVIWLQRQPVHIGACGNVRDFGDGYPDVCKRLPGHAGNHSDGSYVEWK